MPPSHRTPITPAVGGRRDRAVACFEHQVRDALAHLFDGAYLQTHPLARLARPADSGPAADAGAALRRCLIDVVETLRPDPGMTARPEAGRGYRVLALRYVDGLDIAAIQEHLAISRPTLYREHRRALAAVTSVLRERWRLADTGTTGSHGGQPDEETPVARGWRERPAWAGSAWLPIPLTSFIGRERELAAVSRLLASPRLLTLTGAPGTGKTRLALEVAAACAAAFEDGVVFVPLAAVRDPGLFVSALAQALRLHAVGDRPLLQSVIEALRPKQVLLVLDNFEQIVTAAPVVTEVLAACPWVTALVTSRSRLQVRGEREFVVPPLRLPDPQRLPPIPELAEYPAVALFVERARASVPEFALTQQNAPVLVAICRHLDGLPLAIELAAPRVELLPPPALLARLARRLPFLTSGPRDLPGRQQTLRAAIDWSYDLLAGCDQLLLQRLAVFAGGCTLEAVEAACNATDDLDKDLLDGLGSLVSKSLLLHAPATSLAGEPAPRFALLETIQEYALERLVERGEADAVRARHAAYYLALAAQFEPALFGGEQGGALARLDAEQDNLRVALTWYLARDPDAGLRLAGSLYRYWYSRGYATEGLGWLRSLLAASSARTPARVKALHGAGYMAMVLAARTQGVAYFLEAAALGRELGETSRVAWALRDAGQLLERMGEYDRAEPLLAEAQALSRALGDVRGIGSTLKMQAQVAAGRGDLRRAKRLVDEGVVHLRAVGDPVLLAFSLLNSAAVALGLGEAAEAQALVDEALAVAHALGSSWVVTVAWWYAGDVALWRGDLERAASCYEVGLGLAREAADAHSLGRCLAGLGRVALRQGNTAGAIELLDEGLAQAERAEDRPGHSTILLALAMAAHQRGEAARARTLLADSLRLRWELGQRLGVAECLEGLAAIASCQVPAAGDSVLSPQSSAPARVARLLGAAAALREATSAPLPPVERPAYEATVAAARAALGKDAFTAAWAKGQALPLDQAVAEALAEAQAAPPVATSGSWPPAGCRR